jgi:hypothetical protein
MFLLSLFSLSFRYLKLAYSHLLIGGTKSRCSQGPRHSQSQALDKTKGLFGMGVAVRDSDGRLLAAKSSIRRGRVEPAVGMALLKQVAHILLKAHWV